MSLRFLLLVLCGCVSVRSTVREPDVVVVEEDDQPELEREKPDAGANFVRFELVSFEAVCELRMAGTPFGVEWRQLPNETRRGIKSGAVSDELTAFPDEKGIIDCGRRGCWLPVTLDAHGCGAVCESHQIVCAP